MSLAKEELKKEEEYLKEVKQIVNSKLEKVKKENQELDASITETQRETFKNTSGMDIAELEFAATEIERQYLEAKYLYQNVQKLERVLNTPYFGRIDFKEPSRKTKVYIGLSSVSNNEYDNYVYDWRAPISSMYYDYEIGKASYKAPEGTIEGNIDLKRQYKIENGKLIYAFDSSLSIDDEMLKDVLSNNSSEKMKDIVTTIQKEQNEVIRNTEYDNLVVEGAAGSGKTSVALHRIAFILYRYREYINSNNIIIFSPNNVFSEYISDVLPSLGEENVKAILFSEFLEKQMTSYEDIENYSQLIERFHNTKDEIEKKVMQIKMSNDFINIFDKYIKRVINNIKFKDIILDDELLLSEKECYEDFNTTYAKYKPLIKVEKIINNVTAKYKNTHQKKIPGYGAKIKKQITYTNDITKIMNQMYYDIDFLNEVKEKYNIEISEFQKFSLKEIKSTSLKYYDGIIYLYLKAKLYGLEYNRNIKYIIIDEAQDYNLMQYYLIKEYYKYAKFTILGDPNQAITKMVNYDSMESVNNLLDNGKLLKLQTTYRSSYEITDFCNKILNLNNVNMINRHSMVPKIINTNEKESIEKIKDFIKKSINEKMTSIAILCENKENQILLEEKLKDINVNAKLYILPIYSAKGLEFDSVIVCDNGFGKKDKKLYYVACTRALHKLNVLKIN